MTGQPMGDGGGDGACPLRGKHGHVTAAGRLGKQAAAVAPAPCAQAPAVLGAGRPTDQGPLQPPPK